MSDTTFTPFQLRLYAALWQALCDGINPQLAAIGADPLPESAFSVGDPTLLMGDGIALVYASTMRERQAQYWRETTHEFECHVFGVGADTMACEQRVMQLEWAVVQALDVDPTLGGLLTTINVGTSEPSAFGPLQAGQMLHGIGLPIACQPAVRLNRPELAPAEVTP
jgi:hypothetical protein